MRERISSAVFLTSRPGAIRFISRRIIPRFCMSARTAAATPGYWTLTATSAAVGQPRAVDLADRGGGDRLGVELLEDLAQRRLELGLDHLAHVVEAHLRRRVAQRAELALELLAVLLRDEPDVEEAHHLPELHRRALHRPERGHDLLGGLQVAALQRGALALLGAGEVRRVRPELPRRLAGREARDLAPCGRSARWGCGPWPRTRACAVGTGVASVDGGVAVGVASCGVTVAVGVALGVADSVGVGVALSVAVGVGVSSPSSVAVGGRRGRRGRGRSCSDLPPSRPVERWELPIWWPKTASSDAVTTPAPITAASRPVMTARR